MARPFADIATRSVAVALTFLLMAMPSFAAEAPKGSKVGPKVGSGKDQQRLGEVTITGTVEHPGILFFLPRTRQKLLPPAPADDPKERVLRDEASKGDLP